MPDTQASSTVNLPALRGAAASRDAAALAALLEGAHDARDHHLLEKAVLLLQGDSARLQSGLSSEFGVVARIAQDAAALKTIDMPKRVRSIQQDDIAQQGGAAEWGVDQCLTRLTLEQIPFAKGTAAVVGTMRDDGIYILEWVAHHRALGFEHLFVYTNDNADGSDALLDALADAGVLTVIDNEVTGAVPPEVKAFGHAMNLLPALWKHEWALFVDSDEFLVPAPSVGRTIHDVLLRLQEADPEGRMGAVLFDWLWFVSENRFRREPGMLMERFQYTRDHWLGKCLVRLRDTTSMRRQHFPDLAPGKVLVDSLFRDIDSDTYWSRRDPNYAGGRINHYWPKSFEEFTIKKARGAALGAGDNPYDRPYKKFFEWNGPADPDRLCAPDKAWLASVRSEMQALRALPGVADAQSGVERGFMRRLSDMGTPEEVLGHYERNRVPPGPL